MQAQFIDPKFKAVITSEVVTKWNSILMEQDMLKKPIDPAKLIYK